MSAMEYPQSGARSPMFEPLRLVGSGVLDRSAPDLAALQALLARREPPLRTRGGAPLCFVPQGRAGRAFEARYEPRIYQAGEVQVDVARWHDTMNALVWLAFPRAKAALNARHVAALREQLARGAPNRGRLQDAMTLFDEGGVVVASCEDDLLRDLRAFRWKKLFWAQRERVGRAMRFFVFGHALYEKALHPFDGITGRGILFRVDAEFCALPLAAQLAQMDERLECMLLDDNVIRTPRDLAPVPILGVPGWFPSNEHESYYDNARYFRAGRGAGPTRSRPPRPKS